MRRTGVMAMLLVAVVLALPAVATPPFETIDAATLQSLIERGVKVVDLRTPEEWRATGIIPGSTPIMAFTPAGRYDPAFGKAFGALVGRDEDVALICWSGARSRAMAEALSRQAGYTKIYNVAGGMAAWLSERRPVEACRNC